MFIARILCLTTIMAGALACGSTAVAPVAHDAGAGEYRATLASNPSLVQIVRLEHTVFPQNGSLHLVSVIRNQGSAAATVTARICGLTVQGVATESILATCAGYSMIASLAPGDSIVGGDPRIITSPPGNYTLRVQHLLEPALWVDVPIVITP